jgi:hypothetical protein
VTQENSGGDKSSRKFPTSISVFGALIFSMMLAAVALPDYYQYKLREKQLDLWKPNRQEPIVPASSPSTTASSDVGETSPQRGEPIPATADSAVLFESYARFITLLVGLVSVLGFFVTFLIRRSIRETEEDMDKKLDKSIGGWKIEQASMKQNYEDQSNKLILKITEVDTLKEEVSDLEKRLKERLKALDESEALYRGRLPGTGPDADEVAKAVDSALADTQA